MPALDLERLAKELQTAKSLRDGCIVFRVGPGEEVYHIRSRAREIEIVQGAPEEEPLIELIGEHKVLSAILERRKDARGQFLTGGFRIRGNPEYISHLALELGFIDKQQDVLATGFVFALEVAPAGACASIGPANNSVELFFILFKPGDSADVSAKKTAIFNVLLAAYSNRYKVQVTHSDSSMEITDIRAGTSVA